MTGSFFQVDKRAVRHCTGIGLNATVAYLVLARGTGPDNRATRWSTNAIETYTGISRTRANAAIRSLEAASLVEIKRSGPNPEYYLTPAHQLPGSRKSRNGTKADEASPEWVWLPNSIVTGAASEQPPLERLRLIGDVRAIRLLVDLYDRHALADDGGLHWRLIRKEYKRQKVGEAGIMVFWDFVEHPDTVWPLGPFAPFLTGRKDSSGRDRGFDDLWEIWERLKESGLVECVEHLVESDSDEAEIIHPCPEDAGTDREQELGLALREFTAALAGAATRSLIDGGANVLAVRRSYPNVQLFGIYRLRYRPHTKATAAWAAKATAWDDWINLYRGAVDAASQRKAC